jgi:predicted neutral ceramidase superfamily lipid hydrolase
LVSGRDGGRRKVRKKISLFIIPLSGIVVVFLVLYFQNELSAILLTIGHILIIIGWAASMAVLVILRKEKKKGTVSKLLKAAYVVDMIALIWSSLLVIQIIPAYFM